MEIFQVVEMLDMIRDEYEAAKLHDASKVALTNITLEQVYDAKIETIDRIERGIHNYLHEDF